MSKVQLQQKQVEENLRQREKELFAREIQLIERELHLTMQQQQGQPGSTPQPTKRKGKKAYLKLLKKEPGQNISAPSGQIASHVPFYHFIDKLHLGFHLYLFIQLLRFSAYYNCKA